MSDTRSAARDAAVDPPRDARLEEQLLSLVYGWLRRSREASAARTEAAIDRGSFESFPASDPVAPAVATAEHEPGLEEIDCTVGADALVFRCAPPEPEASRPPLAWTIEGAIGGSGRLRLKVWVDGETGRETVPQTLELEPVHASIRPVRHDRRSGVERRTEARPMPTGFDRRRGERRVAPEAGRATG